MTTRARNLRAIALIVIAACGCAMVFTQQRVSTTREAAATAQSAHAGTLAQARRVMGLRDQAELVADRPRPEPDLVARLSAQLQRAGASSASLAGIAMRSSPVRGEDGLVRQSAEVRLSGLDAGKAARFLAAWRAREPLWAVSAVRLQHAAGNRSGATTESFDVRVTLESVHWSATPDQPEGARS